MTHRERVLRTLSFAQAGHLPCDLMESAVWPELGAYFQTRHGIKETEVAAFLDTSFRWAHIEYVGPEQHAPADGRPDGWATSYADHIYVRPLASAETVAEVEASFQPDPDHWQAPDCAAFHEKWPDHARVVTPGWMPLFCGACDAFGMENALVKMYAEPLLIETFVRIQHAHYMVILKRCLEAAEGHCDICWLGDDYASQDALLMDPDVWRRLIKPALAEQVALVRSHGLLVMLHSCGAIRSIIPDLIDIGVNALLVFQTSARGMDAESIARDFGGKMAFYGGIDCQGVLSFGTPEETRGAVRHNARAFARCGGYIPANSHHGINTVRGENVEAMFAAAREWNRDTGG